MAALFVVTLALAIVAGTRSLRIAAAVTALVVLLGAAAAVLVSIEDHSARRFTSDRSRRVELTMKVFRDHPVEGVGLGSQPVASQARSEQGGSPTRFVSHTTPLTVAAELGPDRVRRLPRPPRRGRGADRARAAPRSSPRARAWAPCCSRSSCTRSRTAAFSRIPSRGSRSRSPRASCSRGPTTRPYSDRDARHTLGAPGNARRARRDHDARPGLRRLAVRPALRPTRAASSGRSSESPIASGISGSCARPPSSPGSSSPSPRPPAGGTAHGPAGRRSALTGVVCAMLLVPAVLLQVGLRDATAPWYFTNDSTYQIEIAGDLILDGDNPYGHDYGDSGLERFYPAADDEEAAFDRAARAPLRVLPGHGADRRRVAAPAEPLGRLPALRPARDLRAAAGGPALPRPLGRPPRGRRRSRREPAHRPRGLVRDRRRPCAPGARPLVRAARARTPGLGGGEPGRRARAEAVRARRPPVPCGDAPRRPRPTPHALPVRRRVPRGLPRHRASRS